jgi:hypothetical protein
MTTHNRTEFLRLLQGVNEGPEAFQAFMDYLDTEPRLANLLREAQDDEDTYLWYAAQDCEEKGYQWLQASQSKFVTLVAHALGILGGFTAEEVDRQLVDAYDVCHPYEAHLRTSRTISKDLRKSWKIKGARTSKRYAIDTARVNRRNAR